MLAVAQDPDPPPPDEQVEREHEDGDGRLDAIGWRLEGSVGAVIGADVNIDAVLNFNDPQTGEWRGFPLTNREFNERCNIFVSLGWQAGLILDAEITTGPVFIDGMKNNKERLEGGEHGFLSVGKGYMGEIDYRFNRDTDEVYLGFLGYGGGVALGYGRELWVFDITDLVFRRILGLEY